MKNIKISLLAAGATIALLACSSLEVNNPEVENFPEGWSTAEYISINPDLRALQIADQVAIMNSLSGAASDETGFLADTVLMTKIALEYAGFTAEGFDITDKSKKKYLLQFNINGVSNEPAVFDTLTLDSAVFDRQYIVYGAVEGRPYRKCKDTETALVKKGECQKQEAASVGYKNHLYCSNAGVTYCIDCAATEVCPEVVVEPESSSSEVAPESSEAAGEGESSSSVVAGEGDSSSSEGAGEPESSSATEPAAESSSSEAAGEENLSSVTE